MRNVLQKSSSALSLLIATIVTILIFFNLHSQAAATAASAIVIIPTYFAAVYGFLRANDDTSSASKDFSPVVKAWSQRRFSLLGKSTEIIPLRFSLEGAYFSGDGSKIITMYDQTPSGRMLITGPSGCGKTLLAIDTLLAIIENQTRGPDFKLPILLSLSFWTGDEPFLRWLERSVARDYGLTRKYSKQLIQKREILPILDGLDETGNRRTAIIDRLNEAVLLRDLYPMIVTSRVDTRSPDPSHSVLRQVRKVQIHEISGPEMVNYLSRRYSELEQQKDWAQVFERLGDGRSARKSRSAMNLQAILNTPWMLSVAINAYDAHLLEPGLLLKMRSARSMRKHLLSLVIPAAVTLSDPGICAEYPLAKVESWLERLSFHLSQQAQAGGSTTDIVPARLWTLAGKIRCRVLHGLISVPAGSLLFLVGAEVAPGLGGFILSGAYLFIGAALGLWAASDGKPLSSQIRVGRITQRKTLAVSIGPGFYVFLSSYFSAGLLTAIITSLSAFSATALITTRTGDLNISSPAAPIRSDLLFGVCLGIFGGLYIGLPQGLTGGILNQFRMGVEMPAGAILGLVAGIACGLAIGSRAFIRFSISTLIEAHAGRLPWRPIRFLRWAEEAGLLRVVGSAYQFRQIELKDWLATRAQQSTPPI